MGLGANLTRTAMHAGRVRPGNNRRKQEWFQDLGIHGTEAEKKHVQKGGWGSFTSLTLLSRNSSKHSRYHVSDLCTLFLLSETVQSAYR